MKRNEVTTYYRCAGKDLAQESFEKNYARSQRYNYHPFDCEDCTGFSIKKRCYKTKTDEEMELWELSGGFG